MAMEPAAISASPASDDDVQGIDGAGETGGEREGDGEAVRHADDDVADGVAGLEVRLVVMGLPKNWPWGKCRAEPYDDGGGQRPRCLALLVEERPCAGHKTRFFSGSNCRAHAG